MPQLIRNKELERETGLKQAQIYQLVKEKRIPFVRIGRAIFFDRDEIEEWLKKHRVSETKA